MKGWIANTDRRWFEYLQSGQPWVEVSFWRPSDPRAFRGEEGDPFLFRMKAPDNAIGGFATVARFSWLPDWLAWDCFGAANGAATFEDFRRLLRVYQGSEGSPRPDGLQMVGFIILLAPVFFPRELWIPQPSSWTGNIQNNKSYSPDDPEWQALWTACIDRAGEFVRLPEGEAVAAQHGRYGAPRLTVPRLGQGAFRVAVTDAYDRACAITGEHSLPALEAAHIRPFSSDGPHATTNGLLLRSDVHRLFDKGYVTVTRDYRLEVGRRLKDDYANGRSYYPLHGQPISVPKRVPDRPDAELLRLAQ